MNNKFEWINNNPLVTFEGDIIMDEIIYVDGKIFGDARFDFTKYVIYNFLEVNSLNLSNNEMKAISYIDKSASRNNKKIKIACVIKDDHTKKIILDYISFMIDSNWIIKYFHNINEAIDWCKK